MCTHSLNNSENTDKINLLGLSKAQLIELMDEIGEKKFRAQQILKWIHQFGETDFTKMANLGKNLQAKLALTCIIEPPKIISEHKSFDGTIKWVIETKSDDAKHGAVEAVYIPEPDRATLCISSQVGCILNCQFCHTAKQGFQRNLTQAEIIGQLFNAWHKLKNITHLPSAKPITNIVFMGMGEPLLNLDNVLPVIDIMLDDLAYGLAKRKVTVSTSGVVPGINRLAQHTDVSLALSLHAPNDELRSKIVPLNKKYPIKQVLEACQNYLIAAKRKTITMEYVILNGVNDDLSQAEQLVKLLKDYPAKLNLIPFNPFEGTEFTTSSNNRVHRFQRVLMNNGIVTTIRKTRGDEIAAACGQLAGDVKDLTSRQARWAKQKISTKVAVEIA